jgi:hypothetical protein
MSQSRNCKPCIIGKEFSFILVAVDQRDSAKGAKPRYEPAKNLASCDATHLAIPPMKLVNNIVKAKLNEN